MSSAPTTVRWGILATGAIAETFARDLSVDPKTRGVHEVAHTVVAAASSSSKANAESFLPKVGAPPSAKAYGSYKELVQDPDVDIIYVATPHSHHFQNVMLCLEAGKNVLCEKAFTVNAKQLQILIDKAREKNLFLMEAVWTRYFPLSQYVRLLVSSGALGVVHRVTADLSVNADPEQSFPDDAHRMVNPALAGGCLLDLGVYALLWCMQTLYHTQDAGTRAPPAVSAAMRAYARTGVDEQTSMLLTFPRPAAQGGAAHGVALTSLRVRADPDGTGAAGPAVRVQGDRGEVQVFHPIYRPTRTRLVLADGTVEDKEWKQPGPGSGSGWFNGFGPQGKNAEGEGHGMFWEADECALALREGRKEGRACGLEESLVVMNVLDEVRRQGGLRFPENIESTEYPLDF